MDTIDLIISEYERKIDEEERMKREESIKWIKIMLIIIIIMLFIYYLMKKRRIIK